jgi:hypothetical protein
MAETRLPTDPFDQMLSQLTGLPNGASTQPTVIQAQDFYGNTTSYMVQTVKWDEGETTFVTQVNASGSARYILPPKVLATMWRQREALITQVRRRHGKRIAAERIASGLPMPGLTPEARAKGLATRARKAKARKANR